jgi:hypothetical protein
MEGVAVCLVVEWREWSGADPLPRLFGWGEAGAERLPREYTPRCGFTLSLKIRPLKFFLASSVRTGGHDNRRYFASNFLETS